MATRMPEFLKPEGAPVLDWTMSAVGRIEGCTERDPKKLKACSRVSLRFTLSSLFLSPLFLAEIEHC